MPKNFLSVKEIQKSDIELIAQYWLNASPTFLKNMGVDTTKMPNKNEWETMLSKQLDQPMQEKQSYCIIWQVDNTPIGHSNVNKIVFGKEAYMHLHIWDSSIRKKGIGIALLKMTLPYFFMNLKLKKLYCEPFALNPAPNKTLEKIGFDFVKKYTTIPGWLNFEQEVNLWELSYDKFTKVSK
jgi:RimJ/RimL family protein N-acetyltransferase